MPRPPTDRTKPVPYVPSPPPVAGSNPEEVIRAVWDEFNRIQAVLAQLSGAQPTRNTKVPPP